MAGKETKYISFKSGEGYWAWPLASDSHFFNLEYVLPLPLKNKNIVGLSYHQGQIVTVLNTSAILGLGAGKSALNQALYFSYRGDHYALLLEAGGETMVVKTLAIDKKQKIFKKYFKQGKNKVFCLVPDELIALGKIYD